MTALRLHILPSPLYIESIWRNDVCIERILLHVILHNRERAAVRVKKVEIAFMNAETNSTLVHRFEGQSLEAMLTRSAAMVPNSSGAGAAIAPDEMAGISGYYLELDGEHSFSEVQCAVSAVNEGGTAFQQTHKTRLCRNLPLVQLSLPLKGRWWVAGGHSPVEPHRRGKLQASTYAYDFVRIGADCRTYRDTGADNNQYYAYGASVLAAADGEVVQAEAGHQENIPGQTLSNGDSGCAAVPMPGNHVVLQHDPGEFTFYAHLQPGLAVKFGDSVSRGQLLGWIGNSGESTEPHLHFHFANGPDMNATGLPVLFHNWKEDAFCASPKPLQHGVMLSGEIVESTEAE